MTAPEYPTVVTLDPRRIAKARPLKRYIVTISPYDGCEVLAETASKARWKAIKAFQEAFGTRHYSVREILNRMTTLHLGLSVLAELDRETPK
jgi:hypothetical protein